MYSIESLQELVNNAITKNVISIKLKPSGLYKPIQYIMNSGGKRLRPVLVLMGCDLFGGDVNQVIMPAIGFEMFHNFTLLHDDIMDNAPIRRNKPTVHVKWNTNTAILSGDAMSIWAYKFIAQAPESSLKPILDLFSNTAIKICEGQQYDMEFEVKDKVSVADYLEMIELKTSVLIAACLKAGAIIAGASATDTDLIDKFGLNIGLAFQLQDDWLDVYGNTADFGKTIGGDIVANKKTFLLVSALQMADNKDKKELQKWVQMEKPNPEEKIKAITDIYNRLAIDKLLQNKKNEYLSAAVLALDKISVDIGCKHILRTLAEKLMVRTI